MKSLADLFAELARISLVNSEFYNLINDKNLIDHLIKTYKDQQPVLALCEEFFDAAKKGYLPVIKAFAESGFDINAQSKSGKTALHYAAKNGHTKMVKWLINKDADTYSSIFTISFSFNGCSA